jgi:hypothetical protein
MISMAIITKILGHPFQIATATVGALPYASVWRWSRRARSWGVDYAGLPKAAPE